MTLHHWVRPVKTIAIIAAFDMIGCRSTGEPLGPLLHGTFVLRTVNGGPLPADISTQPANETILLADTLRFVGNSLAKLSRTERLHFSTSSPEVLNFTFDFRVRIDGETIYLKFLCPPNADCVSDGEAAGHLADGNTFVLGDSKPWVYIRP